MTPQRRQRTPRNEFTALALVSAILLSGCTTDDPTQFPPPLNAPAFQPQEHEFDGEFLAGGIDDAQAFPFDVPAGAGEVATELTWTIPGAILEFELLDPTGEAVAEGWAEADSRRFVSTTQPPTPGNWTALVRAEQGVDIHFALKVWIRDLVPFGPIEMTYTIPGGEFAEVNLNMLPGEQFNYTWSADAELYFNIHFHADGTTSRPVEYTGRSHEGTFVAPERQVYSLLLRNEGLLPAETTVTVDGSYRLHSMTR